MNVLVICRTVHDVSSIKPVCIQQSSERAVFAFVKLKSKSK